MEEPMSMILQGDIAGDKVWIETTVYFSSINYHSEPTRSFFSNKGYTYYVPISYFFKHYNLFRLATYAYGVTCPLFIKAARQGSLYASCGYNSPVVFTDWRFIKKEKANSDIKVITDVEEWYDYDKNRIKLNTGVIKEFTKGLERIAKIYTAIHDSLITRKYSNPVVVESSSEDTVAEYNKLLENVALPKSNSSKKEKERKTMNTMTNFINKFNFGAVSNDVVKMTLYGPAFATDAGTYIAYDKTKKEYIDATEFQLPVDGLFYNVPIVAKDLDVGDFIKHPAQKDEYVRVTEIKDGKVTGEAVSKGEVVTLLPAKSPFGFNFYTKLFAPFDMNFMGGEANKDNPFGNILPFILLNDKDEKGMYMSTMALMMAMGGSNKVNPLMFLLLNKNESSTDNLLPLMLLSGGFTGDKSE
jgi:hypothetical protein